MLKKTISLLALFFVFPFALSGCFLDENVNETNDLRVYWQIQGGTCSTADISNVQIDIYDESETLFDTTLTLCSNTETLFRGLPVGVYSVRATGLNGDSVAIYESGLTEVTVDASDEVVELLPPLELGLKRATLEVSWVFESGKLCQFEGVDDIEISIWDQIEIQVLETKTVSCDYDQAPSRSFRMAAHPWGSYLMSSLRAQSVLRPSV